VSGCEFAMIGESEPECKRNREVTFRRYRERCIEDIWIRTEN